MKLVLRQEAVADLDEAFAWYEEQASGLGREFLDAVDEAILGILEFPRRHRVVHRNMRRALLRRFPYSLFYAVFEDETIIYGCFHGSRDPRRWKGRR